MFDTYPDFLELTKLSGMLYWHTGATLDPNDENTWGDLLGYTFGPKLLDPGYRLTALSGEYSDRPIMGIYTGTVPAMLFVLRNYNATMVGRLFPGLSSGKKITMPGTILPGTDIYNVTGYTARLLFVPDNRTSDPCILFQKCCPHVRRTADILVSHTQDFNFPAVFNALQETEAHPDGTIYVGPLSEAVLR